FTLLSFPLVPTVAGRGGEEGKLRVREMVERLKMSILSIALQKVIFPSWLTCPSTIGFGKPTDSFPKLPKTRSRYYGDTPSHTHTAGPPGCGPHRLHGAPVVARCHRTLSALRGSRTPPRRRATGSSAPQGDHSSAQRTATEAIGKSYTEP